SSGGDPALRWPGEDSLRPPARCPWEPDNFQEAFHDDGQHDLAECLRAYRDAGFDGVCRPDHYPRMGDESFDDDLRLARLFAVGYIKGLHQAVYSEPTAAVS
ncbi:MAG: mannonate dehydratase, partial [Candidatus Latescibacteria bacterium]|nr:mannonate dehydratase [Candidatus Latescibacterota bacterium]